jgi:hypothetical protein
MRCCQTILFLGIVILSLSFGAEKAVQSMPATARCPVPPEDDWTSQEKFVWERVCVGEIADFNKEAAFGGKLDPRKLGTLPEDRILRQAFLDTILFDERHRSIIARRGVRIFGARFPELIDLQNAALQNELWLDGCLLEGGADLSWLKSTQPIAIRGSRVGDALNMYGLQVDSNVFLDGSEFTDVTLVGATIGHTLDLSGSSVSGTLDLDSLRVGVHLHMRDAELAEIVLHNAHVPSQLTLERSKVSGLLNMYGIQVGKVLLMNNSEFAEVNLENAHIGGQLDFSGSTFHQNVRLNGAHIGGALQFVSIDRAAQWSEHGILDLRNARADVIPSLSAPWPNKLDLNGLTYRSSGIVGSDFNSWFDKLLGYSRQPYEQLATVLQTQGDADTATAIRYSARDRERREAPSPVRHWLRLLDLVVGYGYYPERSFGWAALFVILGAVVLRVSGEGPKNGMPFGLAYSFDMLLPIVRLREKHYSIDLAGPARYYFYGHRIMGWVLASFLVAGISGLIK